MRVDLYKCDKCGRTTEKMGEFVRIHLSTKPNRGVGLDVCEKCLTDTFPKLDFRKLKIF